MKERSKKAELTGVFPLCFGLSQIPNSRSELEITFLGIPLDHPY